MRRLADVFSVFSRRRRQSAAAAKPIELPTTFRNRVLLQCRERFNDARPGYPADSGFEEMLTDVRRDLLLLVGRPRLTTDASTAADDVLLFLAHASADEFLDFVELVFKSEGYWRLSPEDALVDDVNALFDLDNLPLALTPFVRETRDTPFHGHMRPGIHVVAFPTVVRKDSLVLHTEALEPAIALLSDSRFKSANTEFLAGLEDHRKGRHGECMTKCGSAFESVMKVICSVRGWPHQESDAASRLLKSIITHSSLDPYFEQPLLLIATLRNRLSSAHGAGAGTRAPSAHRAQYVINATASAILLLVHECMGSGDAPVR